MSGEALQLSVATGAVYPKNLNSYTYGSGDRGGLVIGVLEHAWLVSALETIESVMKLTCSSSVVNGQVLSATDATEKFCISDSTCLQSGNTGTTDGKIVYGSYCEV